MMDVASKKQPCNPHTDLHVRSLRSRAVEENSLKFEDADFHYSRYRKANHYLGAFDKMLRKNH
jgi:hypothetical protein